MYRRAYRKAEQLKEENIIVTYNRKFFSFSGSNPSWYNLLCSTGVEILEAMYLFCKLLVGQSIESVRKGAEG